MQELAMEYSALTDKVQEFLMAFEIKNFDNFNDTINEVLSSNAITSLMLSNEYSKPYVDLWKLNAALPKKYRKANYIDLVQDVEAMGYMYDNYATFEALNVLSSSLFIAFIGI